MSTRLKYLLDKESKSLLILGDQCEETKVQSEVNPAPVQRCSWDLLFIFTSNSALRTTARYISLPLGLSKIPNESLFF